jgi:hypothetical protein
MSPASVSQINPYAQANNNSTFVQAAHSAPKTAQATRTDTVAISSQALQLSRGVHAVGKEAKESAA